MLLPFIFLASVLASKVNTTIYKVFQAIVGTIYYLFILNLKVEPFFILLSIAGLNLSLLYLLKLSNRSKIVLTLSIALNLIPLLSIKDYIPFVKLEPNYFISIVGLSYFVLNSISMFVDFYDRKFNKFSPLDVVVYLIYFPKILAGPLVRFAEFSQELNSNYRDKSRAELYSGVFLISWGIIKKWLADYMFQYVSPALNNPAGFPGEQLFISAYIYALYIFLDFSGYTDIARGVSLLMGIRLPENFMSPYLAKNLREFWRRWHITLYQWIRDYVYVKLLGGSRKGNIRTFINIMVAFILSGAWHGNYLNYVLWGALHGLGVYLSRFHTGNNILSSFLGWIVTFNSMVFLWIVFAITDLEKVILYFRTVVSIEPTGLQNFLLSRQDILAVTTLGFLIAFSDSTLKDKVYTWSTSRAMPFINFAVYLLALILINTKVSVSPFLYEGF